MADVAVARSLHEHSSKDDICTRTQKVQKCRQITTNQKPKPKQTNKTTRKSPRGICVSSKQKTANQTHKRGRSPDKKHSPTRFAKGHSGLTTVSLSKTCENELSTTTFKQQHRFIDNASVFFYRLCQDSNMFLTSSPPKVRDLREVSLQVQRQGHQGYI